MELRETRFLFLHPKGQPLSSRMRKKMVMIDMKCLWITSYPATIILSGQISIIDNSGYETLQKKPLKKEGNMQDWVLIIYIFIKGTPAYSS
jgi:hypothetical protein